MLNKEEVLEEWLKVIEKWDAYWKYHSYYGSHNYGSHKRSESEYEGYMRGQLSIFKILCSQNLAHQVAIKSKNNENK